MKKSIGYEEFQYAKGVIAGTLTDETLLPVVFEMADGDDWQLPETWQKVNPGYGTTIQADGLAMEAAEAANEPRKRNDFLAVSLQRLDESSDGMAADRMVERLRRVESLESRR